MKYENPGKIYKGESPKTKFIDELEAVTVTLVSAPKKEDLYQLFQNVAYVSWGHDWKEHTLEENTEFLNVLKSQGMLPLALEMNNFTFLIKGLTRISTHAVVRGRVGVTYAQESTGNSDRRHDDILVPRSLSLCPTILDNYIKWCLDGKEKYANAVDNGISVQEARIFLPSTNSNKIYVSFNLASLMNFYGKRTDKSEEYLQLNEVCEQIKTIFNMAFPEITDMLKSNCGKSCAHSKNSIFVNSVYVPSQEDKIFKVDEKSLLYNHTRDELCWNKIPVKTRYFISTTEVEENRYFGEK